MAIDNELKLRHVESRLRDEELASYFDWVKTMSKAELETELKALRQTVNNEKIAKLQEENSKL